MNKKIQIVVVALSLFLLQACYVAFQHPQVEDYKWGQIQHNDDCSECHQDFYDKSVLPDAAVDDHWWEFYSNSAWWEEQDLSDFMGSSPAPAIGSGSGVSGSSSAPAWNPGPVTSSGSSLGKKNADDNSDTSSRRSSGSRRSTVQGSSSDSKSSSRSSKTSGSR